MTRTQQENSQDKAYQYIKERILHHVAKPGSPLRAQEIAKSLDLSRTPVREALSRLEQEGFVIRQDGWGYIVRPIPPQDILSLFTIRELLEVQATLEAIPNLNSEKLNKLKRILQKCSTHLKQGRYTSFRLASREFHLAIAEISENELLYRLLIIVRDRILLVGTLLQDMLPSRAEAALAENLNILKKLQSGKAEEVKEAVIRHIRASRESLFHESINVQNHRIGKAEPLKKNRKKRTTITNVNN